MRNCRRIGKRSRHAKLSEEKRVNRGKRRRQFRKAVKKKEKRVQVEEIFNVHRRKLRETKESLRRCRKAGRSFIVITKQ